MAIIFVGHVIDIVHVKVDIDPLHYFGGGFLFYPHQRFQLGVTVGDVVLPFSTHHKGGSVKNPDLLGLGYACRSLMIFQ